MIEARPAGRRPVAVTSHAPTLDEALTAAMGKLTTVLTREFGQREHHKGSASIRTATGEDQSPPTVSDDADEAGTRIRPDA